MRWNASLGADASTVFGFGANRTGADYAPSPHHRERRAALPQDSVFRDLAVVATIEHPVHAEFVLQSAK